MCTKYTPGQVLSYVTVRDRILRLRIRTGRVWVDAFIGALAGWEIALGGIGGPGWLREREALGGGGVQGTRDVELRCDAAISNWIECEVGVKQELVSIQSAKTGRG